MTEEQPATEPAPPPATAATDTTAATATTTLRTRTLGKSGLVVSELALGTWGLSGDAHGEVTDGEVDRTLARARELGVTLFETADVYGARGGDPHAERFEKKLGRALEHDAEARVCTKVGNDLDAAPARKRFDPAFLRSSALRSAERLRRAPDLLLLHHPQPASLRRGEATATLEALQREGVIKGWGVACGDEESARVAIELGASVIELAYNLFTQRDLHSIAGEIHEHRVGVLARSPLAYGLLCGTWPADKTFPEGDHRRERWAAEELRVRLAQVAALRPLVHGDVHTIRAVALRWVLANNVVGAAVVGVRSAAQLEANVRAIGDGPPYLPGDDLGRIGELLRAGG
ncbi:MAG: aldo/keto reductase [Polyangiales bacterium]